MCACASHHYVGPLLVGMAHTDVCCGVVINRHMEDTLGLESPTAHQSCTGPAFGRQGPYGMSQLAAVTNTALAMHVSEHTEL
jgi:hypothetical protein